MFGRYICWDGENLAAARSVLRMPEVQKWNKDRVAAVAVRPWQMHVPKEPQVNFREPTDAPEVKKGEVPVREVRRLYIKKADLEAYGYTQGCPTCDHDLQYGYGRTTRGHSDACRSRTTAELSKTAAGRERISAATGRVDQYLSEYVERGQLPPMVDVPAQGERSDTAVRQAPEDEENAAFEPIPDFERDVPVPTEPMENMDMEQHGTTGTTGDNNDDDHAHPVGGDTG